MCSKTLTIIHCFPLTIPCFVLTYLAADQELGDLTTFNAEHGYLEAMVRGFRSGFLREYEYRQLTQCDVLEDVKVRRLTFNHDCQS